MTSTVDALIGVWINGDEQEIPAGLRVSALLDWLDIASDRVAIELNKSIVRKRDWQTAVIEAGAHIEIVEFVGGG